MAPAGYVSDEHNGFWTAMVSRFRRLLDYRRLRAAMCDGDGNHLYLSTACLHDAHDYCGSRYNAYTLEPKKPAECKYCESRCLCTCHPANPDNDAAVVAS